MASKILRCSVHSAAENIKTFRALFPLLFLFALSHVQAETTVRASYGSNKVHLSCWTDGNLVPNALFTFGEPISSNMTGDGNILTVVVTPENETDVRCIDGQGLQSASYHLFRE